MSIIEGIKIQGVVSSFQVMCDAYTPAGEPIPTNKRHNAAKIFSHPDVVAEEPWYVSFYLFIYFW